MRRSAFLLSLAASVGVIVLGVLQSIVLAVALSVLLFFRRSWWPHGAVLGRVDGMDGWHSLDAFPDAREVSDVVVYRWEAPLFFANAGAFRELQDLAARYGLLHTLDSEHFHPSVETALEAIEHDDR